MACGFGMEACKHYYSVRYVRLPDLLLDLQAARDNGTFSTVLKKYTKSIVLIIDEWLLLKLTEAEARNLFELIHKRRKKSSTIFCSQFRESEWYQQPLFFTSSYSRNNVTYQSCQHLAKCFPLLQISRFFIIFIFITLKNLVF